jgi:hypothetical protein
VLSEFPSLLMISFSLLGMDFTRFFMYKCKQVKLKPHEFG